MPVATFTKTGNKATTAAKLDKTVFDVEIKNHELVKSAYIAYLANGRTASANVKTRGLVRGGGKKPWRQKGTGRARFGSSRNPIWRGGGIVFGPTGEENYTHKLNLKAKRLALRQALSLAAKANKLKVVEALPNLDGATKDAAKFLGKIEANNNVLLVPETMQGVAGKAIKNIPGVIAVGPKNLTTYDILNADSIVIEQKALPIVTEWLSSKQPASQKEAAK